MHRIAATDSLKAWEHYDLWGDIVQALRTAPTRFITTTKIEGLLVSDIFALNATLAANIEESFVRTLNDLRAVWDPESRYLVYSFVRQAQTFPDVVLRKIDNGAVPLMGIELKGWYLLAKEKEPTFRFTVTEKVCNPWDLLVVVPWVLSNVLSGSPLLYRPFIQTARYCAGERNRYWKEERSTKQSTAIREPDNVRPYPAKKDPISDVPESDSGHNFGRIARYGVMDDYVRSMVTEPVCGIPAGQWVDFFKSHAKE